MSELRLEVGQKIVTVGFPLKDASAAVDAGVEGVIVKLYEVTEVEAYYQIMFLDNIFEGRCTGKHTWYLQETSVKAVED